MIKKKDPVDDKLKRDKEFLKYIVNRAEPLTEQPFIESLFPYYVQDTISRRMGNSGDCKNELPALVGALMFAGTDLKDENGEFLKEMIKKVYWPKPNSGNMHYNSQQDFASFLFGISTDYVSTIL